MKTDANGASEGDPSHELTRAIGLLSVNSCLASTAGLELGDPPPPINALAAGHAGRGPIIDVHLHGYPMDLSFDDPLPNPATGEPGSVRDGKEHLRACLAEMRRLNIVRGIVSGGAGDRLEAAAQWAAAAPELVVAGAGVRGSPDIPLPDLGELRRLFEDGTLGVLGEVTAQYAGTTLSDPVYEPYLALAEELEIPVAVHTGIGPAGTSYDPCCRGFRAGLGNPLLLEEALNRHPQLRVSLMHAGWPYLQDTIALMVVYPQVHADIGSLNWYFPRDEFHAYLWALMRAGLGQADHVRFGRAAPQVEAGQITVQLYLHDHRDLTQAVNRIRRMFDVDADPAAVADALGSDPLLHPLVQARPGIRLAVYPDGFELAVRSVIGQRVSLQRARAIGGQLVARWGSPLAIPIDAVTHEFPSPETLAQADLSGIGLSPGQQQAVRALSDAVSRGNVIIDPGSDRTETRIRLLSLPGIGLWTTEYVAMRGLGDPDAFPIGDLGVRRALEALGEPMAGRQLRAWSDRFRPWRSYAAEHLWAHGLAARQPASAHRLQLEAHDAR